VPISGSTYWRRSWDREIKEVVRSAVRSEMVFIVVVLR